MIFNIVAFFRDEGRMPARLHLQRAVQQKKLLVGQLPTSSNWWKQKALGCYRLSSSNHAGTGERCLCLGTRMSFPVSSNCTWTLENQGLPPHSLIAGSGRCILLPLWNFFSGKHSSVWNQQWSLSSLPGSARIYWSYIFWLSICPRGMSYYRNQMELDLMAETALYFS